MSYNFENFYSLNDSNGDYTLMEPFEAAKGRDISLPVSTSSNSLADRLPKNNMRVWVDASVFTGKNGQSVFDMINNAPNPIDNVGKVELIPNDPLNAGSIGNYVMYGSMLTNPQGVPLANIVRLPDGRYAFIANDDNKAKIVLSTGEILFYSGNNSTFNPTSLNSYTKAAKGVFNIKPSQAGMAVMRNIQGSLPTVVENGLNKKPVFDFNSNQKFALMSDIVAPVYTLAFVSRQMGSGKRNGRFIDERIS